eukprot:6179259-Pleurochrysis_carterae.AAC.5
MVHIVISEDVDAQMIKLQRVAEDRHALKVVRLMDRRGELREHSRTHFPAAVELTLRARAAARPTSATCRPADAPAKTPSDRSARVRTRQVDTLGARSAGPCRSRGRRAASASGGLAPLRTCPPCASC